MDLALYDSEVGYYAGAARRSGRAGDFFTSVDVGPLFGELLEIQLEDIWNKRDTFDLVEAGAGNGRLSADILRAARRRHPAFYESLRLHLVEASPLARAAQRDVLGDLADRLESSGPQLPENFTGVLLANELIDALPVHQVVMREDGLREVYVAADRGTLVTVEGAPSTPALGDYLARAGATLEPGWVAEINLAAIDWLSTAAARLERGVVILIDYGHEARDLYSASHAQGTLTSFKSHVESRDARLKPRAPVRHVDGVSDGARGFSRAAAWLDDPGERDLTAHVDFTTLRLVAERADLTVIALVDQTYFLLGLVEGLTLDERQRRALKTLVMPGGLGSTHKVLILGKGVGRPTLRGCSFGARMT